MKPVRIGIIGDYDPDYISHRATGAVLEESARRLKIDLDYEWLATDSISTASIERLAAFAGLWASPGSPYRSLEGALAAIRYAREFDRPFIGT